MGSLLSKDHHSSRRRISLRHSTADSQRAVIIMLLERKTHNGKYPLNPSWQRVMRYRCEVVIVHEVAQLVNAFHANCFDRVKAIVVQGDMLWTQGNTLETIELHAALQSWISEGGGRLILLGAGMEDREAFANFFKEHYGLSWRLGWTGRTSFAFNPSFAGAAVAESASESSPTALTPSAATYLSRRYTKPVHTAAAPLYPPPFLTDDTKKRDPHGHGAYYVKAMTLQSHSISKEQAIYLPLSGAMTSGTHVKVEPSLTPAALARVGKGFVGYVGDLDAADESVNIVLAMAGCEIV